TPLTATAHTRARWWTLGLLAGAVAAADLARFAAGLDLAGWLNTALVWVLIHQFGYFYRDGTLDRIGRWGAVTLLAAGWPTLAWLTSLPAYPRSMVATVGQDRSNILPTTAPIAVVALAQVGVAMLLRAPVTRWLRRPAAWKPVVAANAVVMTVFLWHMTALLVLLAGLRAAVARGLRRPAAWTPVVAANAVVMAVFLWHMTALLVLLAGLRAVGVEPPPGPDAAWWWQRPVWLLAPLPVLAVLVAVFGRFERGGGYAGRGAGGR